MTLTEFVATIRGLLHEVERQGEMKIVVEFPAQEKRKPNLTVIRTTREEVG